MPPDAQATIATSVRRGGSVVVVDDHPVYRDAVRAVLESSSELTFAGEAESGEAAVELVRRLAPDFVLMDVRMPGLGGIEATREIKRISPGTIVALISTVQPHELPCEASACRADAIVWKGTLRPTLLDEEWVRGFRERAN